MDRVNYTSNCQVNHPLFVCNRKTPSLTIGVPNPGVFKKASETNTITSKDTHTLIWEVDSYTPVIEYSLWFRPYKTGRGLNRPDWTKLTIPAEHSSGPVYSKSYTLRALKQRTIYEVLLVSRNRYGWSKPSAILRFATAGAGNICPVYFSRQLY